MVRAKVGPVFPFIFRPRVLATLLQGHRGTIGLLWKIVIKAAALAEGGGRWQTAKAVEKECWGEVCSIFETKKGC